jgi:hypothetical protein
VLVVCNFVILFVTSSNLVCECKTVTSVKKLYIVVNIVVDIRFKLLIDNVELVDNEFKLLNVVVDVKFKLLIDNVELVDNEFKFVFVAYTDKSGLFVIAL